MEWTGARYADKPTVEVRTWIDAPPARVWALVSDIELMPRTSTELQSVEWLDGVTGPCVGARFVGHSKHEVLGEWSTTSYIVECEAQRVFPWGVRRTLGARLLRRPHPSDAARLGDHASRHPHPGRRCPGRDHPVQPVRRPIPARARRLRPAGHRRLARRAVRPAGAANPRDGRDRPPGLRGREDLLRRHRVPDPLTRW